MPYESNTTEDMCDDLLVEKAEDSKCECCFEESDKDVKSIEEFDDFAGQEVNINLNHNDMDSNIIFTESNITVKDVYHMISSISSYHHLTKEAQFDIMKMVKVLAGPAFNNLRISKYLTTQAFIPSNDFFLYLFYCIKCYSALTKPLEKCNITKREMECRECHHKTIISLNSKNRILYLDIELQLNMLLQNSEIFDDLMTNTHFITNKSQKNSYICDIYDSNIYLRTLQNAKQNNDKNCIIITYNFNTDGAPIFKSSKKSFWPLQLSINELSPQKRFKHIIVAALCVLDSEPNSKFMNTYMTSFIKKAQKLATVGFTFYDKFKKEINFKFIPLFVIFDSVARPIVQNRLQFNSYWGCSWCYAYGKYVDHSMRFPLDFENDFELRSHESHMRDVKCVTKKKLDFEIKGRKNVKTLSHRGVKGLTKIVDLPFFDCVWGCPVEYMHGMILGVTKQLWEIWMTAGHDYHLKPSQCKEINERLVQIKPPHEIYRSPRSLQDRSKWKAAEWLSWNLYYSFPCLKEILDNNILESFLLFIRSLYKLLENKISEDSIKQCYIDLHQFVGECQLYYDASSITFNVHSVLHLCEAVRRSGPLWTISAFPYESNIYNLKKYIKNPKNVDVQIVQNFLQTATHSTFFTTSEVSNVCFEFYKSISTKKYCTLNAIKSNNNATLLGKSTFVEDIWTYIKGITTECSEKKAGTIFQRAIFQGNIFHTVEYTTFIKTNDSVIETKEGKICKILNFLLIDQVGYCLVEELLIESVQFGQVEIGHIFKVKGIGEKILIRIDEIKWKVMEIRIREECYVSRMVCGYDIH